MTYQTWKFVLVGWRDKYCITSAHGLFKISVPILAVVVTLNTLSLSRVGWVVMDRSHAFLFFRIYKFCESGLFGRFVKLVIEFAGFLDFCLIYWGIVHWRG